ncbi:MOSC N-terminal beta barrel domain-containing protein [Paenalcaligenes niemegkensis]|uniref:MOSC domain-containing protein n=1 Tax=Paenalcaligenes niemegkensis TaxID=2895469 RepID=UPI001EE80FD7|nr:MOSC N-terminal beta barrel domain-containing protein [Paenalcaligenes niemegkensis]MCQ9615589.1 MOSC N-terminal beta barrel domain-containing protein [Paenalcaligenes niemegkensis]
MNVEITDLYVYPIKSCAGLSLQSSPISSRGLKWDREWVIVNSSGQMVTQRTLPRLALVAPTVSETHLHLVAPGMAPFMLSLDAAVSPTIAVTVWSAQTLGYDEGDAVAAWLSTYLSVDGESYRLLRTHPQAKRRIGERWLEAWQKQSQYESELLNQTAFAFADGFPFLICNRASLDELNAEIQKQGDAPIAMERFRPNIVLSGLDAYEEDYLLTLQGGGNAFAKLKDCTRCLLPNVEPLTAEVGHQPWNALSDTRQFEAGVLFGVNAGLSDVSPEGVIRVGQRLDVAFNF